MRKLLVTGAKGQIGSYLIPKMISKYGLKNVIATDVGVSIDLQNSMPGIIYNQLDVTDHVKFENIVKDEGVTDIIHLASILSALAERYPDLAKRVNIDSIVTSCELAKKYNTR